MQPCPVPGMLRPNNSFKPTPLRGGTRLAGKACQPSTATALRGLTQALGRSKEIIADMDKTQAEAVAQAILEPDLRAQDELRKKRDLEAARQSRRRRVAWFTLAGCAAGAAIAYSCGARFSIGVIWGGLVGSAIGWIVLRRAAA